MPMSEISPKSSGTERETVLAMDLEDNLFFLCTQVVYRRNALLQTALKPIGLLPTEYRVLSAVLRKGPLTMLALAQWTAYERTRITHLLGAMEDREWVQRTTSGTDRRAVLVQITSKGEKLFLEAKRVVDELTNAALVDNSASELKTTKAALARMRK